MSNRTCDYTRPGVERWWTTGNQEAQSEDGGREGFSAEPRCS